jgi:hypothetical protein
VVVDARPLRHSGDRGGRRVLPSEHIEHNLSGGINVFAAHLQQCGRAV